MIGQHPEAYGVPELNMFVTDTMQEMVDTMTDVYSIQIHGLLRTVAELYAGEQTIAAISMAYRWIMTRKDRATAEIYKELCRKVAPLRIVDKSPSNCFRERLERIRRAFPDARYLHLTRHPYNMCMSMMNLESGPTMLALANSIDYSQGDGLIDPQFLWYSMNKNICDFLATISSQQQIRLKGEDILGNPKIYFQVVCQWLGWSWNEDIHDAMLHPENSVYASFGPLMAEMGNDPNFLRSPVYNQQPVGTGSLAANLPWRPDSKEFYPHVVGMAKEFGYQ